MTLTPGDDIDPARQRTRDQFRLLTSAAGGSLICDTDDPADFTYICDSDHVLLEPSPADASDQTDAVSRLTDYLVERGDDFLPIPEQPSPPGPGLARRYLLPRRTVPAPDGKDILLTLDELDRDLGVEFARPDHLVHVCGKGSICPATEPSETGRRDAPWPPMNADDQAGHGVRVAVLDTGWYPPAGGLPWLPHVQGDLELPPIPDPPGDLRPYSGHGTFVSGVVTSAAPGCQVSVVSFSVDPDFPDGGVLESQLVYALDQALEGNPHLINLSAGCPTRRDLPARALEAWWNAHVSGNPEFADLVVVASAGNNASPRAFWPASFDWAVGVGSIDEDGSVSSFSNWGSSVDVYALGRNHVNAFPQGRYLCHEYPDRGDLRMFGTEMLARWSGTSFSAPRVTGLIAAAMGSQSVSSMSASKARDQVLTSSGSQVPGWRAQLVPVLS